MKNIVRTFAAFTLLFAATIQPTLAQKARNVSLQTNVAPQTIPVQAPPPVSVILYAGTPVDLETLIPTDSKNVSVGQTIDFRVQYDVVVSRRIVIAAGSPARGIITRLENAKMFGKNGFMEIQPQYVTTVDNQMLPIRAMPIRLEGKKNGFNWATLAFGAMGAGLSKGKSARLEGGMTISASLAATREIWLEN